MNLLTTNDLSKKTGITIDRLRKLHQRGATKSSRQFTPNGPILWTSEAVQELQEINADK